MRTFIHQAAAALHDCWSTARMAWRSALNEWRRLRLLRNGWSPDDVPF
jgi:hypothetical protein